MPSSMPHLAATSPLLFCKHQSTTFSAGLTACPRLCTCHQCAASLWLAHGSMCDMEDLSLLPVALSSVSLDFVELHSCCPHPQVTASRLTPCWYCHVCHTSHVARGKRSKTIANIFTWLVFPLLYSNSTVFPIGKASKLSPMQIQSCRHTSLRITAEEPTTELSHCKTRPLYNLVEAHATF